MAESVHFQQHQFNLAKSIRTNTGKLSGIEPRRLKIYQELFFNNLEGFCATAFPVFKSLMHEKSWQVLVRDFFVQHQCETPHFCEIAQEFLHYLFEHKNESLEFPFMLELAHYEWAELACSVVIDNNESNSYFTQQCSEVDIENGKLTLPERVMPLSYQYPVHSISVENAHSIQAVPTSLIVYRDIEDDVQFMQVDALSIVMLQLIEQSPLITSTELITQINQLNPTLSVEQLKGFMQQAISTYIEKGILLTE